MSTCLLAAIGLVAIGVTTAAITRVAKACGTGDASSWYIALSATGYTWPGNCVIHACSRLENPPPTKTQSVTWQSPSNGWPRSPGAEYRVAAIRNRSC